MTVKFREVGNSITVTIPKGIVNQFGLKQGMEANIDSDSNMILVKPINQTKNITIKSLFANYTGDYKPTEVDWGKACGKEEW